MDSAEHQHGASAAPPPTAAPLPSESNANTPKNPARCNATPKKSEASAAVSAPPPTASSSASKTASGISGSGGSAFPHIKKRPLAACTLSTKTTSLRGKILIVKDVAPPAKAKKTLKKKKKKKFSSILSGMMKPKKTKTAAELLFERESLRENLGGGSFAKVAKI